MCMRWALELDQLCVCPLAGVVKNIIPAVASTNAVIAGTYVYHFNCEIQLTSFTSYKAACATEAFKLATR